MKKLTALLLALVMVLAIGATALADDDNVYTGTDNSLSISIAGTNKIPMNKTVVIFNTDNNTQVREPHITFSYSIAKVDSTKDEAAQLDSTVTDSKSATANVYNGVAAGITAPDDITYSSANKVAATTKGYEDEKTTQIGVDPTAFPHAGIYRYVITETPSVEPETVYMEAHTSAYQVNRYLDVYIYNPDYDATTNPTGHTTQWLGGAVIFKTVNTTSGTEGKDNIDTTFEKTTGFEPGTDGTPGTTDFTNDKTVDRYFTYNLDVTKAITGTVADKTHDFPFQIAITGALPHKVSVDIDNNGAAKVAEVSTQVLNETAALSDGDTYSVTGLPKGSTVTVKEHNNTVDDYKLTTALTGTTSTATRNAVDVPTAPENAIGETDVLINSGSATVKADTKTVVTFTNDLKAPSPTGVVLRFAPYALMLGAGIALFIILKVRKNKAVEEA